MLKSILPPLALVAVLAAPAPLLALEIGDGIGSGAELEAPGVARIREGAGEMFGDARAEVSGEERFGDAMAEIGEREEFGDAEGEIGIGDD